MKQTDATSAMYAKPKRQVSLSTFIFTIVLVVVVGFVLGTRNRQISDYVSSVFGINTSSSKLDLTNTEDVYRILQQNYDGDIDSAKLADGAAQGLTAALGDQFTVYMTKAEANQFSDSLNGRVSGIGAEIGVRDGQPTILRVIVASPAKTSGLAAGDQIVAVNGTSTVGFSAEKTANLIRGDIGTLVKVSIKRAGIVQDYSIRRAAVQDPSVDGTMNGKTGVITIRRFDSDTGDLAQRIATKLKSQGAKSIILDLRDDGGGELDQTGLVAGLWLDSGKTVVTIKHGKVVQQIVTAAGEPILKGLPTVILINGGTASASEIVTGALHDYSVAKTLGEKSYGKGSVQQLFPLDGGAELKVTIARWYTPHDKNINGKGFQPDNEVKRTAADIDKNLDPQLQAALALLNR